MCGQYSDEWLAGGAHTFGGLPRVIGQTLIKCHTQGEEEREGGIIIKRKEVIWCVNWPMVFVLAEAYKTVSVTLSVSM